MDDLRAATEDEVVRAWLEADIDSDTFQADCLGPDPSPALVAAARQLVFEANLNDAAENVKRRTILGLVRGFGLGTDIFTGLANDIWWRRARFRIEEVGAMLYANHVEIWAAIAPNMRTVAEGAQQVASIHPRAGTYDNIVNLTAAIHDSNPPPSFPEIICLRSPYGSVHVMDGHSRATAFVMEGAKYPDGIEAFIGAGLSVANWKYL